MDRDGAKWGRRRGRARRREGIEKREGRTEEKGERRQERREEKKETRRGDKRGEEELLAIFSHPEVKDNRPHQNLFPARGGETSASDFFPHGGKKRRIGPFFPP